jgi:hypothetical protein
VLERLTSAIAANRFGLGSRPGELDFIREDGRDWLRAQLEGAPPQLTATSLRNSADVLAEALDLRREIRAGRNRPSLASSSADSGSAEQTAVLEKVPQLLRPIYLSEATARFRQAVATDHGTATAAFLIGGAVQGGRVIADWPGLSARTVYQGRDLAPTLDLRSVLKGVLEEHLLISPGSLETSVFPDSGGIKALGGLVRT